MWEATVPLGVSKRWADDHKKTYFNIFGPALMACLADCDVGGLFTMAMSGSRLGYVLLPAQPLLAFVLYMAQELTARLGSCSHRSLSGLAFDHLGSGMGCLVLVTCLGLGHMAIISEFTGVAVIGELWGISRWASCAMSATFLSVLVLKGTFSMVEQIGLVFGSCLAVFLILGFMCRPGAGELEVALMAREPASQVSYLPHMLAASVGTMVKPWVFFYQLSASVEKRFVPDDLKMARIDSAVGTTCTQAIMSSLLLMFARLAYGTDLEHMPLHEAVVKPLHPIIGEFWGKVVMTVGLLGSSTLATLVVTVSVTRNCADSLGARGASPFIWRLCILLSVFCGAILVGFDLVNIVHLNVKIQVLNGLMMPVTVGILFALARSDALPPSIRLQGMYATVCAGAFAACTLIVGVGAFA